MTLSNLKITKGVDLFESSTNQDLLQKAEQFAVSGLIDDTELKNDILLLTGNRGEFMSGNWSGFLDKLKGLFKKQKIEVIGNELKWLPVSLYRAYCPDTAGATVKLECKNTNSTEGETSIEILGIGGGPSFTMEFSSSLGLEAHQKSFSIDYEFEAAWEHIRLTERNGNVKEFCKLNKINEKHRRASTRIIENSITDLIIGETDETEEITIDPHINGTKKLSVKSGNELKVSSKIKLESFGLEAGTEITTVNQFEIGYEYVLPGGKTYTAIHPFNASYWLWKVQ